MAFEEIVRDLKLFTENDADIYRRTTTPIVRNLRTKQARGKYDHDKAVQAFMYLAEAGARKCAAEYGGGNWNDLFPIHVRRQAAAEWRDEFEQESMLGNYDNLLPKKYLEKTKKAKSPQPTRIKTPRSEAHYAGMRAGRQYADQPGSSRKELAEFVSHPNHRPHNAAVAELRDMSAVARFLGLEDDADRVISNQTFARAFREFDEGFERGAMSVFDAMEGS